MARMTATNVTVHSLRYSFKQALDDGRITKAQIDTILGVLEDGFMGRDAEYTMHRPNSMSLADQRYARLAVLYDELSEVI